ncbi:phosphoribosylglycinamide formyltransferase [Thiolapillus sp.]
MPRLPVVVLISGGGTNLQAIIDAAQKDLPVEIKAVISNKPGAYGLERARKADIAVATLDHRQFPDRESFDQALAELIDSYQPRLVLLAGFMRILTPGFVRRYHGRMLNIHPSLLPDFQGLHTHQRALEAEVEEHGASIHFVTEELDGGPVILQARVPVLSGDDAQTLAARVLEKEHIIYPLAVRWFAQGRLSLNDRDQVVLDGKIRSTPVQLEQVAID